MKFLDRVIVLVIILLTGLLLYFAIKPDPLTQLTKRVDDLNFNFERLVEAYNFDHTILIDLINKP